MPLVFATSNPGKVREARHVLGRGMRVARIECDEIQSMSTEEVARHKAVEAYRTLGMDVFVEDTGLHIGGLGGFPGPMVKWAIRGMGYEGMCRAVDMSRSRSAYGETCVALCNGGRVRTFVSRMYGTVPLHPRGSGGFGWDCIFVPRGYKRTLAEMSLSEKTGMSMRSRALLKLKRFVAEQGLSPAKRIK